MKSTLLLLSALALPAVALCADAPADPKQEYEGWRAARVARLQKPDGWLTLVGLDWIEPGKHSLGSGKDNDIVLSVGPAKLGEIELEKNQLTLTLAEGVDATIGTEGKRSAELVTDLEASEADNLEPTLVRFGTASFFAIERNGRYALRVKDSEAETRKHFLGIDNYPFYAAWRVEAKFERHAPGATIEVANVLGYLEPMQNSGVVAFEHDGKSYKLETIDEGDGQLFLVYADKTNRKETYGAGRFLYSDPPKAGSDRVVIDFNRSYNPPCVFTPYATCPLPPPGNRLEFAVTAGETKYKGATH
jgi:uncharacterized protein (DUF1684 family)